MFQHAAIVDESLVCTSRNITRSEKIAGTIDRLPSRLVGIGIRQRLGRGKARVADVPKRRGDRPIIQMAAARRPAVRVDEMDVADVLARARNAAGDVGLLDIHVEQIGQQFDVASR